MFGPHHKGVSLDKLKQSWERTSEPQSLDHLGLFFFDLLDSDLTVGNLILDGSDSDRVHLFILGSHEHTCHSSRVDVLDFNGFCLLLVVLVHEVDSVKKGLVVAVVTAHDLHHPVDHLGSEVGLNFLVFEGILVIVSILS